MYLKVSVQVEYYDVVGKGKSGKISNLLQHVNGRFGPAECVALYLIDISQEVNELNI